MRPGSTSGCSGCGETAAGRGYLITRNPNFLQRLEETEIAFDRVLGDLRARVQSRPGKDLLEKVASAADEYKQAQHRILLEIGGGAQADAVRLRFERDVVPKRREMGRTIDAFVTHEENRLEAGYAETRVTAGQCAYDPIPGIIEREGGGSQHVRLTVDQQRDIQIDFLLLMIHACAVQNRIRSRQKHRNRG